MSVFFGGMRGSAFSYDIGTKRGDAEGAKSGRRRKKVVDEQSRACYNFNDILISEGIMSDNNGKNFKQKIKELPATLKVFWNTPPKGRYLNLKEILCFGGSAFGISTVTTIVSSLLTATQIPGTYDIDVIHGAWICLISSLFGLAIQPIFSKMLQNTNTRFGRYKPFILVLAPILAVFAIAATFHPDALEPPSKELIEAGLAEDTTERARTIYAYVTCIPTLMLWNLVQNTFYMMPGVITPNQQERTDIWSPIGLVIGFAPTIMNAVGGWIKGYFRSHGGEYLAYRYMGLIYAVVGLALVLCLFKVKERLIVTNENKEKVGLIEGLRMVMKNKPLLIFTLALILGSCRTVVEVDAEVIGRLKYAVDANGNPDIATASGIFSTLTLITGFAATPNMILLPLMTRKLNNRDIIMIWTGCNVFGYLILGIVGLSNIPTGLWGAVIITALRFVSLFNAIASLQPLMMAEISDYQQLKTGKRLEGFIQTLMYALVLVVTNLGLVVMSYVKQGMDYRPSYFYGEESDIITQEQIDSAFEYFRLAFFISAASAALMLITMFFYKLGKKEHAEIVRQLKERGLAQGNEQVEAETVGIAEHVAEQEDAHDAELYGDAADTEGQLGSGDADGCGNEDGYGEEHDPAEGNASDTDGSEGETPPEDGE